MSNPLFPTRNTTKTTTGLQRATATHTTTRVNSIAMTAEETSRKKDVLSMMVSNSSGNNQPRGAAAITTSAMHMSIVGRKDHRLHPMQHGPPVVAQTEEVVTTNPPEASLVQLGRAISPVRRGAGFREP